MSPDINRILVLFLLVGSVLAVSASLLLMRLYRNAVQRRMSSFGRETVPGPEPAVVRRRPSSSLQMRTVDDTVSLVGPETISPAYRVAMQRPWQTAAVYTAAGTCYALIVTIGWLAATHDKAGVWTKVGFLFWLYLWPTVIAVVLVAAYNPARLWRLFAAYFFVLFALSGISFALNPRIGIGQLLVLWIIVNGLPTVIMLAFLLQPIRAVGPLVLAFVITVSLGSHVLLWIPFRNEGAWRTISEIGFRLDVNPMTVFAGMIIFGVLLFGLLGWALLGFLGKLYEQKKLSDQSIMLDSLWLLFAVVESFGVFHASPWILTGLVGIVGYKLASGLGFRWIDATRDTESQTLLLLRVFALGKRSERLFDKFRKHWQYAGSISMIAGPDLVTSTVEPHEFLEFVRGHLSRRFVSGAQDLERRIAVADETPDPDGRYRVKEFFCYNDTWQMTMERLAATSDAVLMDLRSFSPASQGCIFELGRLLDGMDLGRVAFLIDATTDLDFLETTLQRLWQNLSADSPNQAVTKPRAQLFPIVTESETELGGLLRLLMGSVPAIAAILIGVSGPVEGKQFSVKKHGLLIGRNPKNDLAIAQDEHVSGSHAYLRYEQGGLLIIDRNSRNGTFVNETKLTHTGCVVTSGDRIRVGNSTLEVRITSNAGPFQEKITFDTRARMSNETSAGVR
jgi:FHA domain